MAMWWSPFSFPRWTSFWYSCSTLWYYNIGYEGRKRSLAKFLVAAADDSRGFRFAHLIPLPPRTKCQIVKLNRVYIVSLQTLSKIWVGAHSAPRSLVLAQNVIQVAPGDPVSFRCWASRFIACYVTSSALATERNKHEGPAHSFARSLAIPTVGDKWARTCA